MFRTKSSPNELGKVQTRTTPDLTKTKQIFWLAPHYAALFLCLFCLLFCSFSLAQTSYTVAVTPNLPDYILRSDWEPILSYLSTELGVDFSLSLSDDMHDFEKKIITGQADFVFLDAYHEILAKHSQNYLPLISDGSRQLQGIVVVRRDSDFYSPQDLENKRIGFAAPNACGASLYTKVLLTEEENVNFNSIFVGTHANSYRHVLLGKVDAGVGIISSLERESEGLQDELRIIFETPTFIPHPLSAHPRVPKEVQEGVIDALLSLADSHRGAALLNIAGLGQPQRVDLDRDYQGLNELYLEDYLIQTYLQSLEENQ